MNNIDLGPLFVMICIFGGCAVIGLTGAIVKGILMLFGVDVSWM